MIPQPKEAEQKIHFPPPESFRLAIHADDEQIQIREDSYSDNSHPAGINSIFIFFLYVWHLATINIGPLMRSPIQKLFVFFVIGTAKEAVSSLVIFLSYMASNFIDIRAHTSADQQSKMAISYFQ